MAPFPFLKRGPPFKALNPWKEWKELERKKEGLMGRMVKKNGPKGFKECQKKGLGQKTFGPQNGTLKLEGNERKKNQGFKP